jgi:hypothetical protein
MALVIDATVGGIASNSYATLAEAETYMAERPFVSAWTASTTVEKNIVLVYAVKMMETLLLPLGYAATDTQALDWPRSDVIDCKGSTYEDDEIPQGVKDAQFEQALYLLTKDPTTLPSLLSGGFSEAKADVLEIKVDKTMVASMMSPAVLNILGCFGTLMPGSNSSVSFCFVDRR